MWKVFKPHYNEQEQNVRVTERVNFGAGRRGWIPNLLGFRSHPKNVTEDFL